MASTYLCVLRGLFRSYYELHHTNGIAQQIWDPMGKWLYNIMPQILICYREHMHGGRGGINKKEYHETMRRRVMAIRTMGLDIAMENVPIQWGDGLRMYGCNPKSHRELFNWHADVPSTLEPGIGPMHVQDDGSIPPGLFGEQFD